MRINSQAYKIIGMNKDLSNASFDPKYSWHNKNIRITARDSNNLFNITNERGNLQLLFNDATPIKPVDYIYAFNFSDYLLEQIEEAYTYDILFEDYLVEQSDGWDPPITYEYSINFENYLIEQSQSAEYDSIAGGTIENGGAIKLTVDTDKSAYIILPDESRINAVDGIIDTIWTGDPGIIDYFIEKGNTFIDLGYSGLTGDIVAIGDFENLTAGIFNFCFISSFDVNAFTNLISLELSNNQLTSFNADTLVNLEDISLSTNQLTTFNINQFINISAYGISANQLTPQAIGDNLLSIAINNPNEIGQANFNGGTNASESAIDSYLITQGTTLAATLATLSSWTIYLNP